MKFRFSFLILVLFFFSCEKDTTITFEPLSLKKETCKECPLIEVSIPKAIGKNKIDQVINTALREEVISILKFDDEIDVATIEDAMTSFESENKKLKEKFPEETTQWEAKLQGEVTYEDDYILTIRLNSYLFTGGAHGYSTIRFLNFDKIKTKELDQSELFKDKDSFTEFAETNFRSQEDIPSNAPINSTGFMFENDAFYLPENIGYTKEGLQLFYEQYEIASYADGPIILILAYPEVKKYLVRPIEP